MTPTLTPSRHAIVDELTRRSFLAVLGAAGVLTSCGGREQDARVSAADIVTAKTPYGEFEIPLEPRRLVILEGRQDLEVAVALGLPKPVGLGSNAVGDDGSLSAFVPWIIEGVTIFEGGETPVEKVLALEPDLIIGRATNAEVVKDVAGVPVLPVDREGVDWKTALIDAGRWTGREHGAAEALAGYEEAVNEFKIKHADQLGTAVAAILQPGMDGKWYTCNSDGFYLQARTLGDLGAQYLPFLEKTKQDASAYGPPGAMLEFSDEFLSKLQPADVIVTVASTDEERTHLESNPLWQQLPRSAPAGSATPTGEPTPARSTPPTSACGSGTPRTRSSPEPVRSASHAPPAPARNARARTSPRSLTMTPRRTLSHRGVNLRRFAVVLVLALLPALAACGRDVERSGTDEGSKAEGSSSFFPVKIEHEFGSTSIDQEPERIVSIGFTDHDALLALGVEPVAIRKWYGEYDYVWPWAQEALGDHEPELLPADDLNIEQIAALQPDLIIGQYIGLEQDEFEKLSKIAPTVAQPAGHPAFGAPWQLMTRNLGAAVGKSEEADALVAQVEDLFAQTRSEHPEFDGVELAYAGVYGDGTASYYVETDGSTRMRVLQDLGFVVPDELAALGDDAFYHDISAEKLDLLEQDVVLWEPAVLELLPEVRDNRLYRNLAVAKDERDIFLTDPVVAGAVAHSSVLSLPVVLDFLLPELSRAVANLGQ